MTVAPVLSATAQDNSADTGSEAPLSGSTQTQPPDGFWDRFKDPLDGRLDVTANSEGGSGFVPIPIPFNEPTFGAGLIAGVVYFHPSEPAEPDGSVSNRPPPMTFGGVAGSDNDSWAAAGGHSAVLKDGRLRYLGLLGTASVNVDFYGIGETPGLNENPLSLNFEGDLLVQQAKFQLGESKFAAGFKYLYLSAETTFDVTPDFDIDLGKTTDAGLAGFVTYDTRDNTFTPGAGVLGKATLSYFSESLGGDFDYAKLDVAGFKYWQFRDDRLILGLRGEYRHAAGDAPFYSLPWVSLRGVPALRYLGNHAVTVEIEPRWKLDERWSVVGFAGAGRAARDLGQLRNGESIYNYGFGFRYLLARSLGLAAGIDLARGPEDTVLSLTFGSAWGF